MGYNKIISYGNTLELYEYEREPLPPRKRNKRLGSKSLFTMFSRSEHSVGSRKINFIQRENNQNCRGDLYVFPRKQYEGAR